MSDIIINVSEWMRENVKDEGVTDAGEREVLAYASMMLTKMYLIGETSHKWSPAFKERVRQTFAPDVVKMILGEQEDE